LWWVVKGFAAAPPATVWRTGVSTSMNCLASRKRRIEDTTLERSRSRRLDSLLTTRSR
jgi:hypothetical protein